MAIKRNIISFKDWCINNNHIDILNRWDYDKNNKLPSDVSYGSAQKYFFKCENDINHSINCSIMHITDRKNIPKCMECSSLEYWSKTNNRNDILEHWDYIKNNKSPKEVSYGCMEKFWFRCPNRIHNSFLVSVQRLTLNKEEVKCMQCNSFAQYHINNTDIDFLEKYWDYEKNKINPWEIQPNSKIFIWIKCQEKTYHGSYKILANSFTYGERCGYCGTYKVHYNDSLGFLYPDILEIWSDKNIKSPYKYSTNSKQKVWWKCECGTHDNYYRSIDSSNKSNFNCPDCVRERSESFLQEKVRNYIIERYKYKLNHEYNCTIVPRNPKTKCLLPFDNEIVDLKLIIEVHGSQHYQIEYFHKLQAKSNNTTAEQELHKQKVHDRYKKIVALRSGYFYLEIPYWTENDESYKRLIDNKINGILT